MYILDISSFDFCTFPRSFIAVLARDYCCLNELKTLHLETMRTFDGISKLFRSHTFILASWISSCLLAIRICSEWVCTYPRSLMKSWQMNWNFWVFEFLHNTALLSSFPSTCVNTRVETKHYLLRLLVLIFAQHWH